MYWKQFKPINSSNIATSDQYNFPSFIKKPIEIYAFIEPNCPKCWALSPYLKKLIIEYGRFFTIRTIINSPIQSVKNHPSNTPEIIEFHHKNPPNKKRLIPFPLISSIAIKAAELQGKKAGGMFLRIVQESHFLKKENITNESTLIQCAKRAGIDVDEFKKDLYSESAKRAFQCDVKLKNEMEVDHSPTIVFFNHNAEDEGIKVSGLYPYDIYIHVLSKMLQFHPIPTEKPPLEDLVRFFKAISEKEISIIYDWTLCEARRQMKKLKLKQKVVEEEVKQISFWKYI